MPNDPSDQEPEEGPAPPAEGEIPAAVGMGPLGLLPRFPPSKRHPRAAPRAPEATVPPAAPLPPVGSSEGPPIGISSPASTEPDAKPKEPELADPHDVQEAIAQAVDIGFVGLGQVLGRIDRRARDLPVTDPKWVPTVQEREFVTGPASRIAKRHIRLDNAGLDAVDTLLIGVGVGGFAIRNAFGVDPLEAKTNDHP